MRIKLPEFQSKQECFNYLRQNKKALVEQKRAMPVFADPVNFSVAKVYSRAEFEAKAATPVLEDLDILRVKVVANTANWIDSHMDMLLPDAPKKSITERRGLIPHINGHVYQIESKVGEVVDIYLATLSLTELGLNVSGSTQAVIFVTDVMKDYNPFVFNQYKTGKINQHSIGLQYMQLELCINDTESQKEMDFWNKYYPQVINKDVADEMGFFWVVPEYKLIENSCVLFGSNQLTPTLDNNVKAFEPDSSTQIVKHEPSNDTQLLEYLTQLKTKLN